VELPLGAMLARGICAGNTIMMKTAEDAPLAMLIIAEICQKHLPAGVVNVITGYGKERAVQGDDQAAL
jgi:acyl-CoA reductase-like NAD-dependent aldehyde dehydrogenase